MANKWFERMIVVTLLLIIIIFLFPAVEKLIYKVQEGTINSDVYARIDQVKNLYLSDNQSLNSVVSLPFKVEYTETSYKTYANDKEVVLKEKVKDNKNKPIAGVIIWSENNEISVINLKYKNFTCNKAPTSDVVCKRNS